MQGLGPRIRGQVRLWRIGFDTDLQVELMGAVGKSVLHRLDGDRIAGMISGPPARIKQLDLW